MELRKLKDVWWVLVAKSRSGKKFGNAKVRRAEDEERKGKDRGGEKQRAI